MILSTKADIQKKLFYFLGAVFFLTIWGTLRETDNFKYCWARNQINCGEDDSSEIAYLPTGEPTVTTRSIILLEGHFNDHLSPRMLCTIESAAVAHPSLAVHVMMTSHFLKMTPITNRIISRYDNVKIFYLNLTSSFSDSPIKEWILLEKWKESIRPKNHFTDVLRWALLWKFGGIFLEMDVIVLRNLTTHENFTALESDQKVGTGVLSFTPKHPLVKECLMKLLKNAEEKVWELDGSEILTNILIERCGMKLPSRNLNNCSNINIYESKTFYPIPWWEWYNYLKDNAWFAEDLLQDSNILGLQVWNFNNNIYPVHLDGSSPYAIAARKACPEVVSEIGNQF